MKNLRKKRLPSFLMALVLLFSLVPMAEARSSADKVYTVDPGKKVEIDDRFFENQYGNGFTYLEFTDIQGLDAAGNLYAFDYSESDDQVRVSERVAEGATFYKRYSDMGRGDYLIRGMYFEANRNASNQTVTLDYRLYGEDGYSRGMTGTIEIQIGRGSSSGSHSSNSELSYSVDAGETVSLRARDFRDIFRADRYTRGELNYVVFTGYRDLDDYGYLTADTRKTSVDFDESNLKNVWFHYNYRDIGYDDDCDLDTLTFTANRRARDGVLKLDATLVGKDESEKVDVTVEIVVGLGSTSGNHGSTRGDIEYKVEPGREVVFDVRDFTRFYSDVRYVTFTGAEGLNRTSGDVYYRYEYRDEEKFTASSLEDYKFYVNESSYGDYDLDDISFVADRSFDSVVVLEFRAWKTSRTYEDGTLVIRSTDFTGEDDIPNVLSTTADIRYYITGNDTARVNANDIARFYAKKVPGSTLQYVMLNGVPAQGVLYYNFYGTSPYGPSQQELNVRNCRQQAFVYNPSDSQAYALSELLYLPYGTNNCVSIPFTAYGTDGRSASGSIYISVSKKVVPEVYGQTPKGSAVPFPAAPVYSAVSNAAGTALSGIRLLALPAANVGKIVLGSSALAVDTTTVYGYNSGAWKMSDLRFVPAAGYTGSVEIPYAAYDAAGKPYAAGKVCVGVLNGKAKTFKDLNSKTWCYKYVSELADARIIDGYSDGTFKEKNTLSYGAALKLIMLGAGYSEQAPTVKNSPFSGYLAKAKADGLVSGNVNLKKSITRGEVSQLAAKALKLNTKNLPSVQPFTDTKDPYIQALNAAGIIEGYFSNGTSTFKPNNSLTRGHISAIVWRMIQYRK